MNIIELDLSDSGDNIDEYEHVLQESHDSPVKSAEFFPQLSMDQIMPRTSLDKMNEVPRGLEIDLSDREHT